MTSITDTDLAPVTTDGTDLYLYFQDSQGRIIETQSSDGKSWKQSSDPVATNARKTPASPITAYYVHKDANLNGQSTIHVFYLDTNKRLAEKVRYLSGTSWVNGELPENIATAPVEATRLTAGSYNGPSGWNPEGSQWAYFHQFTDGNEQILELRRTPSDPIYTEIVLPEEHGASLPDSTLSVSIYNGGINLFFQDHDRNVAVFAHPGSSWEAKKVVIPAKDVETETPIAAVRSAEKTGTQRLLVVDKSNQIQHYADGKLVDTVEKYYPGTRLGAVLQGSKVVVFYKSLNPVGAVYAKVYDDGTWKDAGEVVPAE